MARSVVAHIDGIEIEIEAGSSLLEACDAAGRYVPRLCHHPALGSGVLDDSNATCGLCVVRLGDGSTVRACVTEVSDGVEVSTDDPSLRSMRTERLASILARHPHFCLSCSDREGCSRDTCVHGIPPEARCCDKLGSCELGMVVKAVDPQTQIPRRDVAVSRVATVEGRVRREPGLCVACGRCVAICASAEQAGQALEMTEVARPKEGTLRASGCTFCGLCVLICPTGALSTPGPEGAKWLAARRQKYRFPAQILPPSSDRIKIPEELALVPADAGVFTLLDAADRVLRIAGVPDLQRAVAQALDEQESGDVTWLSFEVEPLYTQRESELLAQYAREHGHLPAGNDLGDDLFDDDLLDDDLDL